MTRPTCQECGIRKSEKNGNEFRGGGGYRKKCSPCRRGPVYRAYTKGKKKTCERCGFVPEDMCQLDVDHIDGNHRNNLESNLQTLCSNCHRLKTRNNKDGMYKNTIPVSILNHQQRRNACLNIVKKMQ